MSGLEFRDPLALLALLPLLLLAWRERRRGPAAAIWSSTRLLEDLPRSLRQRLAPAVAWLPWAGLVLAVLALARPRQGLEEYRERREGIAILLALDRSGSMRALDFHLDGEAVDRLRAARHVLREFIAGGGDLPGRPDDLIGLVAFGGFAESRAPLTLDHAALLRILEEIEVPEPLRDPSGRLLDRAFSEEELQTAIGDALALAVRRLQDTPARSRVVILLSDGENTAGAVEPRAAAELAREQGIRVYTIGIGHTGTAPFPVTDAAGRSFLRPQPVVLDEELLRDLARTTGGRYFHARDTDALRRVYAEIDRLEKTELEGAVYTRYRERFPWLLLPALVLLGAGLLLETLWIRRTP